MQMHDPAHRCPGWYVSFPRPRSRTMPECLPMISRLLTVRTVGALMVLAAAVSVFVTALEVG